MNTRRLPLTVFALAVAGLLTWNSPARASIIGTPIPVSATVQACWMFPAGTLTRAPGYSL